MPESVQVDPFVDFELQQTIGFVFLETEDVGKCASFNDVRKFTFGKRLVGEGWGENNHCILRTEIAGIEPGIDLKTHQGIQRNGKPFVLAM